MQLGEQLAVKSCRGELETVEAMLASNFPLGATWKGRTALMLAADRGHDEVAAMLDKAGARTVRGETLVEYKQRKSRPSAFSRLVSCCLPSSSPTRAFLENEPSERAPTTLFQADLVPRTVKV